MKSLRLPLSSLPRDMRLSILTPYSQDPRTPTLSRRNASTFKSALRPRTSQFHHITASPTFPPRTSKRCFTDLERETIEQIKKARLRSDANSPKEAFSTLKEAEIKRIYSSRLNPETKLSRFKDMNGSNITGLKDTPKLDASKLVSKGKVNSSIPSTSKEAADYSNSSRSRQRMPTSWKPRQHPSKVSTVEVIPGLPVRESRLEDRTSHVEGTDYSFSIQNWANRVPNLNSSSSSSSPTTSDTTSASTSSQAEKKEGEEAYAFTIERRKQSVAEPYNFTIARKLPSATVTKAGSNPSAPEQRKEQKRKEKVLENPPLRIGGRPTDPTGQKRIRLSNQRSRVF